MHGLWVFHGNIWTFSASRCFVVAGWAHDLASFCCERQNRRRETLYDPLSKHKSLVPVSSLLSISIATHICSLNILVRFNSMCSEVDHISKKKTLSFLPFCATSRGTLARTKSLQTTYVETTSNRFKVYMTLFLGASWKAFHVCFLLIAVSFILFSLDGMKNNRKRNEN